jgi:hypothetical protein
MSELRRCHSCGSKAITDNDPIAERVHCSNDKCEWSQFAISREAWNTRVTPEVRLDVSKAVKVVCEKNNPSIGHIVQAIADNIGELLLKEEEVDDGFRISMKEFWRNETAEEM